MSKVTLINSFHVPAGREDAFFERWREVNRYMRDKPGYISHKLHRSLSTEAPYRFVNVAEWDSVEHFNAAHDDGFRQLAGQEHWKEFPAMPVLFEVVHQGIVGE